VRLILPYRLFPKEKKRVWDAFVRGRWDYYDFNLVDEATGLGYCTETGAGDIFDMVRVVVSWPACRTYMWMESRLEGVGGAWFAAPLEISPCPHLVVRRGDKFYSLYPVPYLYEKPYSVVAYYKGRWSGQWGIRHLWPPVVAKGGRPARIVGGHPRNPHSVHVAVFPDDVAEIDDKSLLAADFYPVAYAGGVAYLYGLKSWGDLTDELRVPGRGGHLGERFAVYAVEGEYLQMESPWGLDFAINVVLGTVGGRWVVMGKDGLYLARFERAEGPGGRVGYAVVEEPYQGDVREVEGPSDLPPFVLCTKRVAEVASGCRFPGYFHEGEILILWEDATEELLERGRAVLKWPL